MSDTSPFNPNSIYEVKTAIKNNIEYIISTWKQRILLNRQQLEQSEENFQLYKYVYSRSSEILPSTKSIRANHMNLIHNASLNYKELYVWMGLQNDFDDMCLNNINNDGTFLTCIFQYVSSLFNRDENSWYQDLILGNMIVKVLDSKLTGHQLKSWTEYKEKEKHEWSLGGYDFL